MQKKSEMAINQQKKAIVVKNVLKTGHEPGINSSKNSALTCLTMSGIMNITAVIKGEKSAKDALKDTTANTGKAAVTGYITGGGLTTISHTLSSSSSKFVNALTSSNVPGKVITAVVLTGDTLKKYGNGEISTQECIIELGEKGLNFATTGYSMALGQALIPIPVVGAAVGALVGSAITSKYYNELIHMLKTKQLEHEERQRIISECKIAEEEAKNFRLELEAYLESYFRDYQDCFNEAIFEMETAFKLGDANGVIFGANQITKKLGGKVNYETVEEFKNFLADDSIDIL